MLLEIESSAEGSRICAITAGTTNYKSIIKNNNKKHNKIVQIGFWKKKLMKLLEI